MEELNYVSFTQVCSTLWCKLKRAGLASKQTFLTVFGEVLTSFEDPEIIQAVLPGENVELQDLMLLLSTDMQGPKRIEKLYETFKKYLELEAMNSQKALSSLEDRLPYRLEGMLERLESRFKTLVKELKKKFCVKDSKTNLEQDALESYVTDKMNELLHSEKFIKENICLLVRNIKTTDLSDRKILLMNRTSTLSRKIQSCYAVLDIWKSTRPSDKKIGEFIVLMKNDQFVKLEQELQYYFSSIEKIRSRLIPIPSTERIESQQRKINYSNQCFANNNPASGDIWTEDMQYWTMKKDNTYLPMNNKSMQGQENIRTQKNVQNSFGQLNRAPEGYQNQRWAADPNTDKCNKRGDFNSSTNEEFSFILKIMEDDNDNPLLGSDLTMRDRQLKPVFNSSLFKEPFEDEEIFQAFRRQ